MLIHGHTRRNEKYPLAYTSWTEMNKRCNCPTSKRYQSYGGRGIKICKRWRAFATFYADMGERPKGMSLERLNNNGHYTPKNCKWADATQQANNRRSSRKILFNGTEKTLAEWSRIVKLPSYLIQERISRLKWSVEKSFTTPAARNGIKNNAKREI